MASGRCPSDGPVPAPRMAESPAGGGSCPRSPALTDRRQSRLLQGAAPEGRPTFLCCSRFFERDIPTRALFIVRGDIAASRHLVAGSASRWSSFPSRRPGCREPGPIPGTVATPIASEAEEPTMSLSVRTHGVSTTLRKRVPPGIGRAVRPAIREGSRRIGRWIREFAGGTRSCPRPWWPVPSSPVLSRSEDGSEPSSTWNPSPGR